MNINVQDFVTEHGIVIRCCKCKKIKNQQTEEFVEIEKWQMPPEDMVSDGYCPACAEEFLKEIRDYHGLG